MKVIEAEVEAKRLKAEPSSACEAIEASKVKQTELELKVKQLASENKDLQLKFHLCWSKINVMTKRVEN